MSKNELASYVKASESYRITPSECVHLVGRRHFPSRDKDGRHTIVSAIPENHMLYTCKPHGTIFYRTGVMGDGSLHCRNRNFLSLFAPVTLTLTR